MYAHNAAKPHLHHVKINDLHFVAIRLAFSFGDL